jgi:hypothetical protein
MFHNILIINQRVRMARRSAAPPKLKSPVLKIGQKRGRIERLQKCVTSLEAFDPQKARKHAPAVLALEAAIDKALSSAFGYGTPASRMSLMLGDLARTETHDAPFRQQGLNRCCCSTGCSGVGVALSSRSDS